MKSAILFVLLLALSIQGCAKFKVVQKAQYTVEGLEIDLCREYKPASGGFVFPACPSTRVLVSSIRPRIVPIQDRASFVDSVFTVTQDNRLLGCIRVNTRPDPMTIMCFFLMKGTEITILDVKKISRINTGHAGWLPRIASKNFSKQASAFRFPELADSSGGKIPLLQHKKVLSSSKPKMLIIKSGTVKTVGYADGKLDSVSHLKDWKQFWNEVPPNQ